MKAGWEVEPLGELCDFSRGLTYGKGDEVESSGNIVLRATNISLATNLLDFTELKYINDKVSVPQSKKVKKGSLLICTASGSKSHLGKVAFIDDDYGYAFGGFMGMVTPSDALLPKYLFHLLTSDTYKDFIAEQSDGVNINNLKFDDLRRFEVPYPSLSEQKRIVTLLDEVFAHIATAKANAEQNLQNARALFAAGFSSFATATEQDQWSRTTVEAIAAPKKNAIRTGPFGSQLLHGEFVDAGIAVLGIDNAVSNEFRWGKSRFISVEKYKQLERYKVYPGDVLITIMGTCGRCAVVPDDIPIAINTKHLCCITTDWKKCLPSYLHAYFLYHPIAQDFLIKHAKGSIMAGLNMGLIQDLPLLLPAIDRQQEIVERLNLLQKETQRLESIYQQKLSALDALKKSLLHQAFSGQL